MQRIYFVIAGICYKTLQWLRRSGNIDSADLAVFANDDLGLRISCLGEFEAEILAFLRLNIVSEMQEMTFLDVGANLGNHTNGLRRYFSECHAFEADPRTYNLLHTNMARMENVTCHQFAVSNINGTATFARDRVNTGKSQIIDRQDRTDTIASDDHNHSDSLTFTVQTQTLDDTAIGENRVGLLKIDVEGHELQVLQGAAQLLRRQKPTVLIELLAADITNGQAASLDYLASIGYGKFQSIETPTMRIAALNNFSVFRWINHLIHAFELIFIGQRSAKAVEIDITKLAVKNYDAVLAFE